MTSKRAALACRMAALQGLGSRAGRSSFFPSASEDAGEAPSRAAGAPVKAPVAAPKAPQLAASHQRRGSVSDTRRPVHSQNSSAVRAWRFPSSRRFLWDRTPVAPCIHLHPQVCGKLSCSECMLNLPYTCQLTGVSAYCCGKAAGFHSTWS